jgi:putative ABC transport system permease protein
MESVFRDLKFAVRMLYRSRGIAALVVLALALGIGANSAMFGVVDAMLLHPLNFPDAQSLTIFWDHDSKGILYRLSAANFLDLRTNAKSFSEISAWVSGGFTWNAGDRPEALTGASVSANFFRTLGVKPQLGRTFLPDEDGIAKPGAAPKVVIISHRFWRDQLGGDPNVLGKTLRLNSISYAVIGVLPPDFLFVARRHDFWLPISINPQNREFHYLVTIGRRTATPQRADSELSALSSALEAEYPKSNKGWRIQSQSVEDWLINSTIRTRLMLLFGAVGLVLMIACTNVASLLMARASARSREIAVRISLGATRGRLTRQLLTESVLLSLIGGALGLVLGWALIAAAPSIVPPATIPASAPIRLSGLVVAFTLAISILTGILFGMAPALSASRPDVQESLRDGGRGSTAGRASQRFRQTMVAAEVAVAVVLLASAALMIRSLNNLAHTDLGFDVKRVLTLRLFLPMTRYGDGTKLLAFHREATQRIAALPGIQSVSVASGLPLARNAFQIPFDLTDVPPRDQGERPGVNYTTIAPQYLEALHLPLKRGRGFTDQDIDTAPPVVIVNEAFAERYFQGRDAVGQRIVMNRPVLGGGKFESDLRAEIVGVVGNVRFSDLTAAPDPVVYAPDAQNVWAQVTYFAIRTAGDSLNAVGAIRRELLAIDRDQPIDQVSSLEQTLDTSYAEPRFQATVMGAFAVLALLLAIVGIYGINAFTVAQRGHEIGLRMALGATPGIVLRQIVMQGMALTAAGIVVGLASAVALGSVLKSVLVGVSPTDPVMLAAVILVVALVAAAACYVPARRATKIDPAVALRQP